MSSNPDVRLRVFAGPNGSGKSTVIKAIQRNGTPDLGRYINADDLVKKLFSGPFQFKEWDLEITKETFLNKLENNSLINRKSSIVIFDSLFDVEENMLILKSKEKIEMEYVAQVLAEFLRVCCFEKKIKFSFETVFSHHSKVEWMRKCSEMGYKVYLYFVSTESPEINKARVANRVLEGGHDVPEQKIEDRYYRSLDLMFEASKYAYQAYFFDTSGDSSSGNENWFAHFKRINGKAVWDEMQNPGAIPNWFIEYYVNKQANA